VASVAFLKKRWALPSTTFIHLQNLTPTSSAVLGISNSTETQTSLLASVLDPVKRKTGTPTPVATSMPPHVPYWAPRQTIGPISLGQSMEDKDVLERRRKAHEAYTIAGRYGVSRVI
jgi:hypothetical protein